MNEIEMLEVTRRYQSELRELAKVNGPDDDPEPPESGQEREVRWLSWRFRYLRLQAGGPR